VPNAAIGSEAGIPNRSAGRMQAYKCPHGIKNRVICAEKVLDSDISWASVKAKAKVDVGDAAL
jgi:hypothetical protein